MSFLKDTLNKFFLQLFEEQIQRQNSDVTENNKENHINKPKMERDENQQHHTTPLRRNIFADADKPKVAK